ncbi:conserved hypothetical protein [Neospora caninum Liverpool]|uniref:Uncharacterized protein n=1 Tax=Neospora caninum (strain Liverpool) TaxID=572307 RepID=F0V9T2_NEOCL|nr:conserved hypothetical protein [Neospora caninum Liverpool]CBZ50243.1 conserved hypothetical protein [Neospora caninum Liverpool]|eukprot:XP_003880278.1 conserved hypothetical protein [Neospora caninum Liverpool]
MHPWSIGGVSAEPKGQGVPAARTSRGTSPNASAQPSTDPWMPSLDLAIPESHDTRKTVYDVLADVENTPSDNLFFAIARDVVNTYQLTKPFLDEFLRLQQQQRAKQKAKNSVTDALEDAGAGAIAANAIANPNPPFSFPSPWGNETDNEDTLKVKKKRREERETKKHQERRKSVKERSDDASVGDGSERPSNKLKLFGHAGSSRLLTATAEDTASSIAKRGNKEQTSK